MLVPPLVVSVFDEASHCSHAPHRIHRHSGASTSLAGPNCLCACNRRTLCANPSALVLVSSHELDWSFPGIYRLCCCGAPGCLYLISKGPVVLNDGYLNGKRMKPPAKGRRARLKQHQQSRGCTSPGEFASALHHRSFSQKRRAGW